MTKRCFFGLLFFVTACNYDNHVVDAEVKPNDKTDVKLLAKKANEFYETGNYRMGIVLYDSLISIDSTKAGYFFKRGYCKSMVLPEDVLLSNNDNKRAAIADYKKAIELNYSEKEAAYLNLGVLYELVFRKVDSAFYYYNECLKIDPNEKRAIWGREEMTERLVKLKSEHSINRK